MQYLLKTMAVVVAFSFVALEPTSPAGAAARPSKRCPRGSMSVRVGSTWKCLRSRPPRLPKIPRRPQRAGSRILVRKGKESISRKRPAVRRRAIRRSVARLSFSKRAGIRRPVLKRSALRRPVFKRTGIRRLVIKRPSTRRLVIKRPSTRRLGVKRPIPRRPPRPPLSEAKLAKLAAQIKAAREKADRESRARWQQQMGDFLSRHVHDYVPAHYRVLQALAAKGDVKAFFGYAQAQFRKGFWCNEHRMRHGCDQHCDMKHNQWHNTWLRPGCKFGCKMEHKWLPGAARTVEGWFKAAGKLVARGITRAYIELHRAVLFPFAQPLTPQEKSAMSPFFPTRLLDNVRVLEIPLVTGLFGFSMSATTYGSDLIVFKKGHRQAPDLLKHEMVHVCQYDKLGRGAFADLYADQLVDAGFQYGRKMELERQAYDFAATRGKHVKDFLGYCAR